MILTANFASTCLACDGYIPIGERIAWDRAAKRGRHLACTEEGRALFAQVEASRAASVALGSNIDVPAPPGREYLPFQKAGIAYLRDHRACILGDQMGLGKSVELIGLCNLIAATSREPVRVLIVCPKSLLENWQREIHRWTYGNLVWERIHYEKVKDHEVRGYDILAADEAHYLKNESSKRSKAFAALAKATRLEQGRVVLLTGTPLPNRPIELYNLLALLGIPETETGRWAKYLPYIKRFCAAYLERIYLGRHVKQVWNVDGNSNLAELQEKLRSTCLVRRLKIDVLAELPAKRRSVVDVGTPAGPEDADVIRKLPDDPDKAMLALQGPIYGIGEMSRKRHEDGLAKVAAAGEYIKVLLDGSDGKVVVFAHHHDVLEGLATALKAYGPVVCDGRMTAGERDKAVQAFQGASTLENEEGARLILCGIQAMGVGHTLTASSDVAIVELPWGPGELEQAEDRLHRIGQKESVNVHILVRPHSVDAHMAHLIVKKANIQRKALDKVEGAVNRRSRKTGASGHS